jgi:hypothetical protein
MLHYLSLTHSSVEEEEKSAAGECERLEGEIVREEKNS